MSDKKNCNYSLETLTSALNAIKNGMPIKTASKEYRIPKTTLHSKHYGKYPIECKAGAPTILSKEEEAILVKWIIEIAKVGFPVTKEQLLKSFYELLKKKRLVDPFRNKEKNCLPGRHWYEGFLRRHPDISNRMTQNLVQARAQITEQQEGG
jgi:Tc5 transposase DNA-binding domain/helix-turn-helix, Psq domain